MAQLAPPRGGDIARLIVEPGTVLLPEELAGELGLASGDSTTLTIGGRAAVVRVIGVMPAGAADVAAEPPIVADIATAQELLGTLGRIDRIDLDLTEAQARALAAAPPAGAMLVAAETEDSAFRELTAAFRTNLTALGLLALVVGMFLIYGTMAFAILQRTQTLGILRTLGVSRAEILRTILWEAFGIAAVATALGLVLGHVLAIGLVDLVLRTIGDLSFNAAVDAAEPSPWIYAQGAALGFVATLLAAAKPALDAARIAPAAALRRAVLERRAHEAARRAAYVALPVLAASGLVLAFGPSELYAAFRGIVRNLGSGRVADAARDGRADERDRSGARRPRGNAGHARGPRRQRILEPHRRRDGGARRLGRDRQRRRAHDRELPLEPRRVAANDVDGRRLRERTRGCGSAVRPRGLGRVGRASRRRRAQR